MDALGLEGVDGLEEFTQPLPVATQFGHRAPGLVRPPATRAAGSDPVSVADANLGVQGIEGLRVADAPVIRAHLGGGTRVAVTGGGAARIRARAGATDLPRIG